tara:strand:- start:1892 stop:2734 length:843 start_codon:yes stop_codon:yes gene_type:complete
MKSLLIMAGGNSSRMKKSIEKSNLSKKEREFARKVHKSLIPIGKEKKPLLYYLISNAVNADISDVYLITGPENKAFQKLVGKSIKNNYYAGAKVHFAIQFLKDGHEKPLGTADAVEQTLDQYPELLETTFIVCNGDNLYSTGAFKQLTEKREDPHALISYARSALKFKNNRIQKFAIMDINDSGYLSQIIEKPNPKIIDNYRDSFGEIRVSMNIFSFYGKSIYPYLKKCPIHSQRKEKELPEALKFFNESNPNQIKCFAREEHILDLTSAEDLNSFTEAL